jgi:uncharacterized protein
MGKNDLKWKKRRIMPLISRVGLFFRASTDPQTKRQNLQMVETNITMLLEGKTPRLIDEWQLAPKIWDAIRFEVDHRDEDGQFMLTGSTVLVSTD